MLINKLYRFIFFHIPKNAGTAVTRALEKLETSKLLWGKMNGVNLAHLTQEQSLNYLTAEEMEYEKLCILRNPYDRFLSAIRYLYVGVDSRKWLRRNGFSIYCKKQEANKVIDWLADNPKLLYEPAAIHLRRQVDWVFCNGKKNINTIWNQETLTEEFDGWCSARGIKCKVRRLNCIKSQKGGSYFNSPEVTLDGLLINDLPHVARVVEELYRDDFERLGFQRIDTAWK